jgi:hypothetical protein
MYSGRRYCVQRHINNIHGGGGAVIPFVDYIAGRRTGWYPPGPRPSYGTKHGINLENLQEKMKEEVRKIYIRRVAEQTLPASGDPRYKLCANDLRRCLYDPNSQDFRLFD